MQQAGKRHIVILGGGFAGFYTNAPVPMPESLGGTTQFQEAEAALAKDSARHG